MDSDGYSRGGGAGFAQTGRYAPVTILFSNAMFRAVVGGRKTQTRRIVKPHGIHPDFGRPDMDKAWVAESFGAPCLKAPHSGTEDMMQRICCPYGYAGGLVVAREPGGGEGDESLLLKITDVRLERLQDISDEDAVAEGVDLGLPEHEADQPLPTMLFERLWNSIYGEGAWDKNPWVWVISFARAEGE